MTDKKIPPKWRRSEKSLRAIQVAFEFGGDVPKVIREEANRHGLSTSDQIRSIIGLEVKPPKRPRLTVSLSEEDYRILAERYNLLHEDKAAIRKVIRDNVVEFSETILSRNNSDER